jgi:lycopene beta-cyclase
MFNAQFDILITGAGAAGLSLAYHLNQAGLSDKRILLIDRAQKTANDRTWCFWEHGANPFESIVFRQWGRVAFHGHAFSKVLDLAPYRYKMIRGMDFYAFMSDWVKQQANITQVFADVVSVADIDGGAAASTADGRTFHGTWAFNSIQFNSPVPSGKRYHHLLQHFLGWVIQTPDRAFDPTTATLMDFRVDQFEDTRFVYVLPFDEHTALVEYTVFSRELLPRPEYVRQLECYIADHLRIANYEEQHEEFGVIPMTDAPYPAQHGSTVFNIGTAGGQTKPSTGYTFQRIQRQCQQIAHAIKTTGTPQTQTAISNKRYELFDSVLLNVLDEGRHQGKRVFTELFARNPPQRVFRFLDEDTSLLEDLQIMGSVNIPAFVAAITQELLKK